MKYLLDTNVLIRLLSSHTHVMNNLTEHPPKDIGICGITIGEIHFGIEKSAPAYIETNRLARTMTLSNFSHLFMDNDIAKEYGKIKAELSQAGHYTPNNENDIWISAHARAKGLIIVTENLSDFKTIGGLTIESWATSPPSRIKTSKRV